MNHKNTFKFALLGATALTLAACGEAKEEVLAFDSVEACIKAGEQDEAVCKAEFAKAQKLHNEVAPRYNSANQCYSDFGYNQCRQYRPSSGTSVWLPFMAGYMLAPRGGPGIVSTQPLYRPSSNPNRYYTAGNSQVGKVSANGRTQVARSQVKRPPVRTRTVTRGGFGARATGGRGAGS
jgi:uncharacterized protein YgiB involved in biofilm formation